MTTSVNHNPGGGRAPLSKRALGSLLAVVALLAVIGGSSLAAAALGRSDGTESFSASFEARSVADPTITACRALPAVQKIEGRYQGTFSIATDEERLPAHFAIEILFDRATGLGLAEGSWQLANPPTELDGTGKLTAVVKTADLEPPDPDLEPPDPDLEPPDPDLELHGLLVGTLEPPDPDIPAQKLVGNFSASLGEGATFPFLEGSVGDPTSPTANPALLLPAVKC